MAHEIQSKSSIFHFKNFKTKHFPVAIWEKTWPIWKDFAIYVSAYCACTGWMFCSRIAQHL